MISPRAHTHIITHYCVRLLLVITVDFARKCKFGSTLEYICKERHFASICPFFITGKTKKKIFTMESDVSKGLLVEETCSMKLKSCLLEADMNSCYLVGGGGRVFSLH